MTKPGKRNEPRSTQRRLPRLRDLLRARHSTADNAASEPADETNSVDPRAAEEASGPEIVQAHSFVDDSAAQSSAPDNGVTDVDPPHKRAQKAVEKGQAPARQATASKPVQKAPKPTTKPAQSSSAPASTGTPSPVALEPNRPSNEAPTKAPKAEAEQPAAGIEIAEPLVNTGPIIVDDGAKGGMPIVGDQKSLDFGGPRVFEFPSMSLLQYEAPARTAIDKEALSRAAVTLEQKLVTSSQGQVVKSTRSCRPCSIFYPRRASKYPKSPI